MRRVYLSLVLTLLASGAGAVEIRNFSGTGLTLTPATVVADCVQIPAAGTTLQSGCGGTLTTLDSLTVTNAASVGGALTASSGTFRPSVDLDGISVTNSGGRSRVNILSPLNTAAYLGFGDVNGETFYGYVDRDASITALLGTNFSGASMALLTGAGVNAVTIDSSQRVGINTASPATTLDVNGSAQFGSGATKSTFSATGFLTIAGSTLTVASSGAIDEPSNPYLRSTRDSAQNVNNAAETPLFFGTDTYGANIGHDVTSSSDTFTLHYAGKYRVTCRSAFATNATGIRQIQVMVNGSNLAGSSVQVAAVNGDQTVISTPPEIVSVTAGQTVKCIVYQNSGGVLNITGTAYLEKIR